LQRTSPTGGAVTVSKVVLSPRSKKNHDEAETPAAAAAAAAAGGVFTYCARASAAVARKLKR